MPTKLRLPPLDMLLTFESAARELSFTRAASERFITQSAVSKQIRTLEDDLGIALFRRGHRSLQLTDEGRQLYEASQLAFERLRLTVARLRSVPGRQVLTMTATPGFAALWLIPRLSRFTRDHPDIDVRVDASAQFRNLQADNIDLAVRYGPTDRIQGEPLLHEVAVPVCSPGLLRDGPPLRKPSDLAGHTLLRSVGDSQSQSLEWQPWLEAMGQADLQPAATLGFTQYDGVIAAATLGQGVAMGRRPLIDDLLRDGRLVTPFEGELATPRGYFIVVNPQAQQDPMVRALSSWLLSEAGTG